MLKRKLHFAASVLALIANSRADSHKIGIKSNMYGTSLQVLNLSFYQDSTLTHAVVMLMLSFCDYSSDEREIIVMNE
jgi:hypothetical protein